LILTPFLWTTWGVVKESGLVCEVSIAWGVCTEVEADVNTAAGLEGRRVDAVAPVVFWVHFLAV
jgi:hypothetical protein